MYAILHRFNMHDCKLVRISLLVGSKFTLDMCPKFEDDFDDISNVSYASVVVSVMYAMVCTRLDIAQAVGIWIRFMSNLGREHWNY